MILVYLDDLPEAVGTLDDALAARLRPSGRLMTVVESGQLALHLLSKDIQSCSSPSRVSAVAVRWMLRALNASVFTTNIGELIPFDTLERPQDMVTAMLLLRKTDDLLYQHYVQYMKMLLEGHDIGRLRLYLVMFYLVVHHAEIPIDAERIIYALQEMVISTLQREERFDPLVMAITERPRINMVMNGLKRYLMQHFIFPLERADRVCPTLEDFLNRSESVIYSVYVPDKEHDGLLTTQSMALFFANAADKSAAATSRQNLPKQSLGDYIFLGQLDKMVLVKTQVWHGILRFVIYQSKSTRRDSLSYHSNVTVPVDEGRRDSFIEIAANIMLMRFPLPSYRYVMEYVDDMFASPETQIILRRQATFYAMANAMIQFSEERPRLIQRAPLSSPLPAKRPKFMMPTTIEIE
jgi:hypothetical protein